MSDDGPPRSGRDGVLWRAARRLAVLADSSVRLDAPAAHAFLSAKANAHLGSNAYPDGSGNWLRYDTAAAAAALAAVGASQQVQLLTAPAGANPIAWTTTPLAADSGWVAVAGSFAANWSDFNTATDIAVGYKTNALGEVVLKGMAKKGIAMAMPETIFNLPAGFRPQRAWQFPVNSNGAFAWLKIDTAGNVVAQGGVSAVWVSFAGVRFDPATV